MCISNVYNIYFIRSLDCPLQDTHTRTYTHSYIHKHHQIMPSSPSCSHHHVSFSIFDSFDPFAYSTVYKNPALKLLSSSLPITQAANSQKLVFWSCCGYGSARPLPVRPSLRFRVPFNSEVNVLTDFAITLLGRPTFLSVMMICLSSNVNYLFLTFFIATRYFHRVEVATDLTALYSLLPSWVGRVGCGLTG